MEPMEYVIAIALLGAGVVGGVLVYLGKRDPLTARFMPGFFRYPGSFFEPNRQHDDKRAPDKGASGERPEKAGGG